MTPEFSRPVLIDTLSGAPRGLSISAGEGERIALARRFDLVSIESLSADFTLTREGETVVANGLLRAAVTQSCVASAIPVAAEIKEDFALLFRPQPETGEEAEIELSENEMDVVFYQGAVVDLGEAAAETLALSLDPFPRSPQAEAALRQAGVIAEEEAKPLGPLAGLKDLLNREA